MSNPIFICQLPITEQQAIIFRASAYLRQSGMAEDDITECLSNIMDEKICNILNEDGSLNERIISHGNR